jgi:hypothetical protein
VDDEIIVTALDETSGAFAKATLTVVDAAAPDSVTVLKVYDPADDDAVLDVNSAAAFQIAFSVKDQYGYTMDPTDAAVNTVVEGGLAISSSKTGVISLADPIALGDDEIDDVDYFTLPITAAGDDGTAAIRFISTTTGKTTTYNVLVKEAAEVDTITVSNPSIAVEDEDIDFLVTATDQYGNAITSAADLNDADTGVSVTVSGSGITVTTPGTFVKEDGKLYYRVEVSTNVDVNKTMYLNFVTATNKIVQKSMAVRPEAVPTVVAKIQNIKTGIVELNTSDIVISDDADDNNIVIYDQYDRAMDISDFFATGYDVRFTVDADDAAVLDLDAGVATATLAAEGTVTMNALDKGTAKVTIELLDAAAALVADSGLDFNATVVEVADIESYGVETIDTVYAVAGGETEDYTVEVDVYGVLSNGTKVAIPASMYSIVSATAGLTVSNGNELDATAAGITWATDSKTATGSIVITIGGAEGPVSFTKEVALSKAAPKATTFELADGNNTTVSGNTVTIALADANDVEIVVDANTGILDLLSAIEVTDQYGVVLDAATVAAIPTSIIFSAANDADDDDSLVLTNGDADGLGAAGDAKIAGAEADDTFTMTCIYSNGQSVSINIVIE